MPRPDEVCEVAVGGKRFRDWTAVQVVHDLMDPMFRATLSTVEYGSESNSLMSLRLKPGDQATVTLAGYKVIDGAVWLRQAGYDAARHGVMVGIVSKTIDIVRSSAMTKSGQFKGYPFASIARSVLAPYGINLVVRNPPPDFARPFDRVHIQPGETVWQLLDRLGRMRGLTMTSDPDGNLVAGQVELGSSQAILQEGGNILRARCIMRDDALNGMIYGVGQGPGNDQRNGEAVASPTAFTANSLFGRYRPLVLISEQPGTQQDLQHRVDREKKEQAYSFLQCAITVQGWLRPDGEVWQIGKKVTVKSPMLLLDNKDLAIQSVTFEQDAEGGTTTTLDLVSEAALGSKGVETGPEGTAT
ncbi:MAG: phage baseplate assembly protein [Pseudolabrys sp.]